MLARESCDILRTEDPAMTKAKPAKTKKKTAAASSASRKSAVARARVAKAKVGRAPTRKETAKRLAVREDFWSSLTPPQRMALVHVSEPKVSGGRGPLPGR